MFPWEHPQLFIVVNMKIQGRSLSKGVNQYKIKITTAWQKSVEGILETAQLLNKAKNNLSHPDYFDLCNNLPFSSSSAEKLVSISKNKQINNPSNLSSLPPHWTTLYELSLLPEKKIKEEIKTGNINPDVERGLVVDFKNQTNSKSNQTTKKFTPISKKPVPPTAKLASIFLPQGFDINEVDSFQNKLEGFCKKNGVIVKFDGSKSGVLSLKRQELSKKLEKWMEKKNSEYRKRVSDSIVFQVEEALSIKKGLTKYHSGTHDESKNKFLKMETKEIYEECRKRKIITKFTPFKDIDKEAYVNSLILQHSRGDSKGRFNAKKKLIDLFKKGKTVSRKLAKKGLATLIEE